MIVSRHFHRDKSTAELRGQPVLVTTVRPTTTNLTAGDAVKTVYVWVADAAGQAGGLRIGAGSGAKLVQPPGFDLSASPFACNRMIGSTISHYRIRGAVLV